MWRTAPHGNDRGRSASDEPSAEGVLGLRLVVSAMRTSANGKPRLIRDLKIRCDAPGCRRGVVHGEWPQPCPVCGGRGSFSLEALCEKIGECESTMRKLFRPHRKMRAKVAARICAKIVDLVTPPKASKQQEMFA